MHYVQYLIFFTLAILFLFCKLLGEFMLLSNILPRTYRDLSSIMKDIWMEYKSFDVCPNDHIIYYGQYVSKT